MPIFGGKPKSPAPNASLTASGERIDLTNRSAVLTGKGRDNWQQIAWSMHDSIGELSGAHRLIANTVSKVTFYPAQVNGDDDEPLRFDAEDSSVTISDDLQKAAEEVVERLPFRSGYAFQGVLATCFQVAGEAYLYGRIEQDGTEEWSILSTDEVTSSGGGRVGIAVLTEPGGTPRTLGEATYAERQEFGQDYVPNEVLMRLWIPQPRWKRLADSPLRTQLGVCENILLYDAELRAVSNSRASSNGILAVPDSMYLSTKDGTIDVADDGFTGALAALLLAPIQDPGNAGSVVPGVLRGAADDIAAIRHITLERETSDVVIEKRRAEIERLREGTDLPPETMAGVGQSSNHWSGALVTANAFKDHIEPLVRQIVDSLTVAYLRTSLTRDPYNFTAAEAAQVQIWYDAGAVTENANRSEDATTAYDRGELSGASLRTALGFSESDSPDDDERERIYLFNKIAARSTGQSDPQAQPQIVQGQPATPTVNPNANPGAMPTAQPENRPAMTLLAAASNAPGFTVVTNSDLVAADAALLEKLLTAADAAVVRAVERASTQAKAAAQGKPELAAMVNGIDATKAAETIGEDRIIEFGIDLDSAIDKVLSAFRSKFVSWSIATVRQAVRLAAKTFGLSPAEVNRLTSRMTARVPDAWTRFEARLAKRAQDALYGRYGDQDPDGESIPDTIVAPGDVRDAMAYIGGHTAGSDQGHTTDGSPIGGIGAGPDLVNAVNEAIGPAFGIMWNYREYIPRNSFHPHKLLDDHRFDSLDDPRLATPTEAAWLDTPFMHPGDHRGCLCQVRQAWIMPENRSAMTSRTRDLLSKVVADETPAMQDIRMLAESDDAAGRTNTQAQRDRDARDRILRIRQEWLQGKVSA